MQPCIGLLNFIGSGKIALGVHLTSSEILHVAYVLNQVEADQSKRFSSGIIKRW